MDSSSTGRADVCATAYSCLCGCLLPDRSFVQSVLPIFLEQCFSNLVPRRGVRGSVKAEEFYWQSKICMYECKSINYGVFK